MNQSELTDFATRYAEAWSSQNPERLAAFYTQDGSLSVNAGAPSVGRAAIAAKAQGFMAAFPDMVVKLDRVRCDGSRVTFHWIWTGTNTGPGGTGKSVNLKGYEEWTFGADGLIAQSKGHYDEAEYQRQIQQHGEILPNAEMKEKYQLTADKRPIIHLDPSQVPADLRDLIPHAEKWGIGDDIIREDFESKASQSEKAALAAALKGRNARITQWLDGFTKDQTMSAAAAAFMYMQLSLDEMGLWVD